jgi:hypothetical protein
LLRDPCQARVKNSGVDFVCYTDRDDIADSAPKPWRAVRIDTFSLDGMNDRVKSRFIKMRPDTLHEADEHGATLWLDSDLELRADPLALQAMLPADRDMLAFRHPTSRCLEDEAAAIARRGMVKDAHWCSQQLRRYRSEWPREEQREQTAGGLLLRRHRDAAVDMFDKIWWAEYYVNLDAHERDQISIDYAIHKSGLQVQYLPGHYRRSEHVAWRPA